MTRAPFWPLLVLLCAGVGVGGCSTGWHKRAPKRSPVPARSGAAPAGTPSLEDRADAYAHYAAGVVHDLRGEAPQAEAQFRQAIEDDPGNEPLVMELAHRLLQEQQAARAVELLSKSVARPDASGQVYGWLGLALTQDGKTNQAMVAFRTAIDRSPQNLMGYHGLAQLYLQTKQPQEVLRLFDVAAKQKDVSPGFLVDAAEFLALAGRSKLLATNETKPRVLALLERAARQNPTQPLVLQKMADTYKAIGELSRAAEMYQDLLKRHASNNPAFEPVLREQLVRLYLASGEKQKAAEQLKEILRLNPTAPKAYLLLGALAAEDKRFAEAAGYYEKAVLMDADLEPAYYDLAGMQLTLGQLNPALETLTKARAKFGANFLVEFYSGVTQAGLKQYAEAIKNYTSAELLAKASDPSRLNQIFFFQVGSAYERLANVAYTENRSAEGDRHFAEAERNLRKSIELSPDNAEALNYLGYMWAERGINLEEAKRFIEKALQQEPESAAYLDSLAWVLFQMKAPERALEPMLKAIKLSAKPDPTLYDHLGDIQAALGRTAEAQEAWRKSLALERNDAIQRKLEASPNPPRSP